MATIKSFTDLEQSKKLAEILPVESADMKILPFTEKEYRVVPINDIAVCDKEDEIPCWSLAALIDVIPKEIFNGKYVINITEGKYNKWIITYDSGYSDSFYGLIASDNNLVDACVYIIERAYKLNLL